MPAPARGFSSWNPGIELVRHREACRPANLRGHTAKRAFSPPARPDDENAVPNGGKVSVPCCKTSVILQALLSLLFPA